MRSNAPTSHLLDFLPFHLFSAPWIDEYSKKYNLSLFAYCLMDNHVHFIAAIPRVHISRSTGAIYLEDITNIIDTTIESWK